MEGTHSGLITLGQRLIAPSLTVSLLWLVITCLLPFRPCQDLNHFACSFVCVHVYADLCYTCVHVEARGYHYLSSVLSFLFLKSGSHTESEARWDDYTGWIPGDSSCLCLYLPRWWNTGTWIFHICVSDRTQVLLLAWQTLYCHIPSSQAPIHPFTVPRPSTAVHS